MNTELRFLLAILLMLGVLVGTNLLFPPVPPEEPQLPDSTLVTGDSGAPAPAEEIPVLPETTEAVVRTPRPTEAEPAAPPAAVGAAAREVAVEGPLFRYTFSTRGAALVAAEMLSYKSFTREGPVDLVPPGVSGYLGHKVVVGQDTVDLTRVNFEVEPEEGLRLSEDGGPGTLRFVYQHPTTSFRFELTYEFTPELYAVRVTGRVEGLERALVVTELGDGLAFAEADSVSEARSMAYVANHVTDGIDSWQQTRNEARVIEGPLSWAAFRSKFFVLALLAGSGDSEEVDPASYLGGMLVAPSELPDRTEIQVALTPAPDGSFGYRLFMGPQEHARLSSLGEAMQEVNPYGWRFFRPIIRPIVAIIIVVLGFLHDQLNVGYGWVLVLFGVLMRVVLWPLNQKAMKSQLRNMAVQPLVQEIQTKYKENPEKLQKEMMKLYKEHGFNPFGGCLPMLLPWPVLISLFFVFQNAIEFRGVPFLWLPDLSSPDPLYVLPVFLGLSMFLMQYVSMKSLDQPNPQMKMMMYIMPVMMVFIFFRLASGLNLYYATANIATIPQQIWIANERKKVKIHRPSGGDSETD